MTNQSPVTMSNVVAGAIGLTVALIIMPQIIIGSVSAQQKGAVRSSTNNLVEDIGNVCGNEDEVTNTINLQDGYELTLNYDNYTLTNPEGETLEERKMACKVDSRTTIDSSWSGYTIESEENDDGEDLYDISEGQ